MGLRIVVALLLLAASYQPAQAQSDDVSEDRPVEKHSFRMEPKPRFNKISRKVMPQSKAGAFAQDKYGFLWVGTQGGLARYDGYEMITYTKDEEKKNWLSSNFISTLATDAQGKLWIGTQEGGVNMYDPDTLEFTVYRQEAEAPFHLEGNTVLSLFVDSEDNVWVGTDMGGISVMGKDRTSFAHFTLNDGEEGDVPVTAITEGKDGLIYAGTAESGALVFAKKDPEQWNQLSMLGENESGLKGFQISAMTTGEDGSIWIGTKDGGLTRYGPKDKSYENFASNPNDPTTLSFDTVEALLEDKKGNLWVATESGFNLFHKEDKTFTRFNKDTTDDYAIADQHQMAIFEDKAGTIWVGTWSEGINYFDLESLKFNAIRYPTTLLSFEDGGDGKTVWIGSYKDGLIRLNRETNEAVKYTQFGVPGEEGSINLADYWIMTVHRDKKGELWIGTLGGGFMLFDPKSEHFNLIDTQRTTDLLSDNVMDIVEDEKGNLWIGTFEGGLHHFDTTAGVLTPIQHNQDMNEKASMIYSLAFDKQSPELLWLSTKGGGLVRFNTGDETPEFFEHNPEDANTISHNDVNSIFQDAGGTIWVATYGGGLNRLDPKSGAVTRYTDPAKVGEGTIYGILADKKERLWFSTNGSGLIMLDPKTEEFTTFRESDGVQDNEFAQGSFMTLDNGLLAFGGLGGLNIFAGEDFARDESLAEVLITKILVGGKNRKLSKPPWAGPKLALGYTEDVFSFEFSSLAFHDPEAIKYEYKLSGFDKDWTEVAANRRFATYTDLPGGDYTFKVRATNRHGKKNETFISIPVEIDKPPWLRIWAFGIYLAIIAGGVFIFLRYQKQKLAALEQENRLNAVERDLELTAAVQDGFLPEDNAVSQETLGVFGFYRPAESCSGDWWWHEQQLDGKYAVLVGDVTGHGPGPAMVTAAVATAYRVQKVGVDNLEERLKVLNEEVLKVGRTQYQMVLTAMIIDVATGEFEIYSCGGLPLIMLTPGKPKAKVIPCRGTPLGTADMKIGRAQGKMAPGGRVILYTDGIPEIEMPNGRQIGLRRFSKLFHDTNVLSLPLATDHIVKTADAYRNEEPQDDDWTFAIVEWGQDAGAAAQAAPAQAAAPAPEAPPA